MEARRIAVRIPNWVGDVVHCLPALEAIRHCFAAAEITALSRGEVGSLLHGHPAVDKVITYARERASFFSFWRTVPILRRFAFDLGIVLTNAFEGALLFFLAGIPRRVGYATDGRRWLLTDPVACSADVKRLHQTDYYLSLLSPPCIHEKTHPPRLYLQEAVREGARQQLAAHGWTSGQPLVAICPGAGSGEAKRWPMNRFCSLAQRLTQTQGVRIIFLGGPGEQDLGKDIDVGQSQGVLNFSGRTTLREAMALIDVCQVVVSNDSGLLHVAAALGVPSVALFGPTDPERTAPRQSNTVILRKIVGCSPCELHDCPLDHRCMNGIVSEEVYAAVTRLFGESATTLGRPFGPSAASDLGGIG